MMKRGALVVVAGIIVAACSSGPAASGSPTSVSPATSTSAGAAPSVSPAASVAPSAAAVDPWIVVALGDSIPFNLEEDCPGCRGFVDQYQLDFQKASGHRVTPRNLSKHTGLRLQGLLDSMTGTAMRQSVSEGDVIIVSIGGNDIEMNVDTDPCDGAGSWDTLKTGVAAAKLYTVECAAAWAETMRPKFDALYSDIAGLRAGKPTVLLTINRYNDWIGWCENRSCSWGVPTTPIEAVNASRLAIDAWDSMVCESATKNGFTCVDIYHSFNGPDGSKAPADLVAEDYVHPSQAGNDRIAELLAAEGYDPVWP